MFKISVILFIFLFVSAGSAGTLEDIHKNTNWQPAEHSKRSDAYIPLVTPSLLIANLDKYHRDTIKMNVLFDKITTRGLNKSIGPKNNKHTWSSKRYIAFSIKDPQKIVTSSSFYLFLAKRNPDKDLLLDLKPNTEITIIGMVKNIDKDRAWINVKQISNEN